MVRIDLFHPVEPSLWDGNRDGYSSSLLGGSFVLCGCRSGFFCRCLCFDLAGRMRPRQGISESAAFLLLMDLPFLPLFLSFTPQKSQFGHSISKPEYRNMG